MSGEELTAKQIKSRFGLANPTAAISSLRMQGYPIYCNPKGQVSKYRLGTASRRVIAAGYKALAAGVV
jgi:hypothetical protein